MPQTCPINLSISRKGKLALLGKVNLIINGEERGESSVNIPISSSIRANKRISSNVVGNSVKQVRKTIVGKGKQMTKQLQQNHQQQQQQNQQQHVENMPMVKIKGDTFQFGLENNAMLRVLVNVHDPDVRVEAMTATKANAKENESNDQKIQHHPHQNQKQEQQQESDDLSNNPSLHSDDDDSHSEFDDDDDDDDDSHNNSLPSLEGESSLLDHNDYYYYNHNHETNELGILRQQLAKSERTNAILQMELADAAHTAQLTQLQHAQENEMLRRQLNEAHSALEALPIYEARITELLEELKQRDLEVDCLKGEIGTVRGLYKERLADSLLWDKDDDGGNDAVEGEEVIEKEELGEDEEDDDDEEGDITGSSKTVVGQTNATGVLNKWGVRKLGLASTLSTVAEVEDPMEDIDDSNNMDDGDSANGESSSDTSEGASKDPINEGEGMTDETTEQSSSLEGNKGGGGSGGGGWGVRRLGASLMSMEERMRERQRLFREQQEKSSALVVLHENDECENNNNNGDEEIPLDDNVDDDNDEMFEEDDGEEIAPDEGTELLEADSDIVANTNEDEKEEKQSSVVSFESTGSDCEEEKEGSEGVMAKDMQMEVTTEGSGVKVDNHAMEDEQTNSPVISSEGNDGIDEDQEQKTQDSALQSVEDGNDSKSAKEKEEAASEGSSENYDGALNQQDNPDEALQEESLGALSETFLEYDASTKKPEQESSGGGGGWGVRRLGASLMSMEERLKERQRLFREQQQREQEMILQQQLQQQQKEVEEPGLGGGVLISRLSSHGSRETVPNSEGAGEESCQENVEDVEKESSQPSDGKNDDVGKVSSEESGGEGASEEQQGAPSVSSCPEATKRDNETIAPSHDLLTSPVSNLGSSNDEVPESKVPKDLPDVSSSNERGGMQEETQSSVQAENNNLESKGLGEDAVEQQGSSEALLEPSAEGSEEQEVVGSKSDINNRGGNIPENGAPTEISSESEEENNNRNYQKKEENECGGGGGGWGVRKLIGASLMSMEERMKERQRLFREQQQREQENIMMQQQKEASSLPGLGGVLLSKLSSHGNGQAAVTPTVGEIGQEHVKGSHGTSAEDTEAAPPPRDSNGTTVEESTGNAKEVNSGEEDTSKDKCTDVARGKESVVDSKKGDHSSASPKNASENVGVDILSFGSKERFFCPAEEFMPCVASASNGRTPVKQKCEENHGASLSINSAKEIAVKEEVCDGTVAHVPSSQISREMSNSSLSESDGKNDVGGEGYIGEIDLTGEVIVPIDRNASSIGFAVIGEHNYSSGHDVNEADYGPSSSTTYSEDTDHQKKEIQMDIIVSSPASVTDSSSYDETSHSDSSESNGYQKFLSIIKPENAEAHIEDENLDEEDMDIPLTGAII